MAVQRLMPTEEGYDLIELTREIADKELLPKAASYEREERFPREAFTALGQAGLLGLPFPEEHGGGGQPYEVYLQVLEEIAARWAAVAVGVSVYLIRAINVPLLTETALPAERIAPLKKRWHALNVLRLFALIVGISQLARLSTHK